MFSKQQLVDALKACLLALVLGRVGAFYLRRHVDAFAGVAARCRCRRRSPAGRQHAAGGLGLLLLALGRVRRWSTCRCSSNCTAQQLKMSHQEVKQEHKELEGNAEVKGKVRAAHARAAPSAA